MPSDRDTAGETFNNTYHNDTLVGNWLEDRLQRSAGSPAGANGGGRANGARSGGGLLEDPRITQGRHAPQVRQDLMHTTYGVDYGHEGSRTDSINGGGGGGDGHHAVQTQSVLLASAATTRANGNSGGGGSSSGAKEGVSRPLLFSKDPVADPVAALPVSTNTDTYGAFFHASSFDAGASSGGREGEGETTATRGLRGSRNVGDAGEPRNLYESVVSASAGQQLGATDTTRSHANARSGSPGRERAGGAAASLAPAARGTTLGFTSLAAPASGTVHGGTINNTSTVAGRSGGRGRGAKGTDDDADGDVGGRWCTSRQAADVPVEHYTFQRRLPPVRM